MSVRKFICDYFKRDLPIVKVHTPYRYKYSYKNMFYMLQQNITSFHDKVPSDIIRSLSWDNPDLKILLRREYICCQAFLFRFGYSPLAMRGHKIKPQDHIRRQCQNFHSSRNAVLDTSMPHLRMVDRLSVRPLTRCRRRSALEIAVAGILEHEVPRWTDRSA